MMTSAPAPVRHTPANATISAFGTTKAFPGFAELPNVKLELAGLVRGKQGNGLFFGREYIDERFTRRALASGLLFGTAANAKLGIVHIASHFKLGTGEADSFLLLGTGERLSIKEIRTNMGASREFDFGDVDLLTLSACETAYVQPATDGRVLESFATATQEVGVRSVIGTLWPISDQTTPIFMRQFYMLSTKHGISRDVALVQAQRSLLESAQTAKADGNLLRDYSHPYYWAPFVLLEGIQ
jgi:CHAT domain-containing protein